MQLDPVQHVTAHGCHEIKLACTATAERLRLCRLALLCDVIECCTHVCLLRVVMLQAVLRPDFAAARYLLHSHAYFSHAKGASSMYATLAESNDQTHALPSHPCYEGCQTISPVTTCVPVAVHFTDEPPSLQAVCGRFCGSLRAVMGATCKIPWLSARRSRQRSLTCLFAYLCGL